MKKLTSILIGLITSLFVFNATWAEQPDKDQFCFAGSELAHYAVLGECSNLFFSGNTTDKNFKALLVKWGTLAKKGDPNAQFNMGKVRALGADMKDADETAAAQWYARSAIQGNTHAQNNLANMYRDGEGVTQDLNTAIKWYTVAAENGNAGAQTNLGVMYQNGIGVPQNYQTAFDFYYHAAVQGYGSAQFNLGLMFEDGLGTKQNTSLAHMWYNLAASRNNESAQKNRDWLQSKMTPLQIEEAQNLATECLRKGYQDC